jgi:glucosamine-6-phosphate deaminase
MPRFDECLSVSRDTIVNERRFPVTVLPSQEDLSDHFGHDLATLIEERTRAGMDSVVVLPVGPFQYHRAAAVLNARQTPLARVHFINMDEFVTGEGSWIEYDHPLSFRRYMDREFFGHLDLKLKLCREKCWFPEPRNPAEATRRIESLGGIDVSYGGIGLDCHWAFNCPEDLPVEQYAQLPTRVLRLSPETRCQTAIASLSGDVLSCPPQAVTLGMRELLAARLVKMYLIRPWQSTLMRRCLYGPKTSQCPSSLFQDHPGLSVVMLEHVAAEPRFGPG